jgi:hypothetical protein
MRCGFVVLMKTSSKSMVFSNHQKKIGQLLFFFRVEVSSLCTWDSKFIDVPLHSPTIPRLVRMHQKTITMHSLPKTGVVVWSLGCEVMVF